MTDRRFPDNTEVDAWIAGHFLSETEINANANPVFDQMKAATVDSVNRFQANAPGLVADGVAASVRQSLTRNASPT